jgi:hypothetical protein
LGVAVVGALRLQAFETETRQRDPVVVAAQTIALVALMTSVLPFSASVRLTQPGLAWGGHC